MNVFLFGQVGDKPVPELDSFVQNSDGNLEIGFSGVEVVEVDPEDNLRWLDLVDDDTKRKWERWRVPKDKRELEWSRNHEYPLNDLFDKLEGYCNEKSETERFFYNMFVSLSMSEGFMAPEAAGPALLPNVYVNWYADKLERVKNVEPYVADFMLKYESIEDGETTIIEIDGPSHYATYDEVEREYTMSEEVYARHCRKDLWLRRHGFNVVRIGRADMMSIRDLPEEDRLEAFYKYWNNIFDDSAWIEGFEDIDPPF